MLVLGVGVGQMAGEVGEEILDQAQCVMRPIISL